MNFPSLQAKSTVLKSIYNVPASFTQMLHGAGIFTYMSPKTAPNVGKYSIHGASGL
jgi:hypothetical protein